MNTSPQSPESDPMSIVVSIDPGLSFSSRENGIETLYVAHDTRTGKYYRFGNAEFHLVSLMNGKRTLAQIQHRLTSDGLAWSALDVATFARELTQKGLASIVPISLIRDQSSDHPKGSQPTQNEGQPGPGGAPTVQNLGLRLLRLSSTLLTQRFPLFDGDRVARLFIGWIGFLFSPALLIPWCGLVATGLAVVYQNSDAFALEIRKVFDQQLWLVMAAIWFVLKIIHELGHAVCAKRHGVRVGKMGVMLFLFAPLAYVDVTDAWRLGRKRDRIQIALAGVYLELAIGAMAAIVWWNCSVGFTKHFAAQVFLLAGPATLLVNANPLLRLDGYYVLSDLFEIPNLRAHGRNRLRSVLETLLLRLPREPSALNGWRRDFAMVHAACSVVFQFVWMGGLIVGLAKWNPSLGIALAIVATLTWGVFPLVKWLHRIWTFEPSSGLMLNVYQRRLMGMCVTLGLIVHYAVVASSPFARRIPIVIRHENEQIARAPINAFVCSVYVKCGDRVEKGTRLLELDAPELTVKREGLADESELASIQAIQHRNRNEIALADAAMRKAELLNDQVGEIDQQLASLQILAERDGRIVSPAVDRLLGSFVHQGDELLRVSDPNEKEVLVIVAEGDMQAYREAADDMKLAKVRLRGGTQFETSLRPLDPSASRALPHPALAATTGGPLAMQAAESTDANVLVLPRLRSQLPLDALTSLSVRSGQVGRLTIPDDRSLVSRIWQKILTE